MTKRKSNMISTLQKHDGTRYTNEQEIKKEMSYYYRDLFTTTNPDNFEEILVEVLHTITS